MWVRLTRQGSRVELVERLLWRRWSIDVIRHVPIVYSVGAGIERRVLYGCRSIDDRRWCNIYYFLDVAVLRLQDRVRCRGTESI